MWLLFLILLIIVAGIVIYYGPHLPDVETTSRLTLLVEYANNPPKKEQIIMLSNNAKLKSLHSFLKQILKPNDYFGVAKEKVENLNRLRYSLEFLIADCKCAKIQDCDDYLRILADLLSKATIYP
jgi:hypothetical protein